MSNRLPKYAFSAGIISEEVWSQTVLQKYGYGVADAVNYVVRFTGSLVSRAGLIAAALMQEQTENFRFVPFTFAKEDANNFSLLFTPGKIRFLQAGAYVLEAAKTANYCTNAPSYTRVETAAPHGYAVGDLVELYGDAVPSYLRGQTVQIVAITSATSMDLQQIALARNLDDVFISVPFTVRRVYTVPTPFTNSQLPSLYFRQSRDVVRITSRDIEPHTLTRQSNGTWTLTVTSFGNPAVPPGAPVITPSIAGTSGYIVAVTAINADKQESLPSVIGSTTTSVDFTVTAGSASYKWTAAPEAIQYNVYRSIVVPTGSSQVHAGMDLGYLATTAGTKFTDRNVIPDFTRTVPTGRNPFALRSFESFEVTAPGSGYGNFGTITVSDPTGTGAILTPIFIDGELVAVSVGNGGRNYTAPVFTITSGAGTGAAITPKYTGTEGTYPAISATHSQRQLYASTGARPLAVFGSRIGKFNDFNFSKILAADEAFSYELSSETQGVIKHMISTRVGLLAFSDLGVWALRGSGGAITATDSQADLQTSVGCSALTPLLIDSDILYGETDNQTTRLLQYNDFSKNFAGTDISVLARHLLASPRNLISWSYESRPYKLVWSVRDDGQVLSTTISQEEKVFAWSRHTTAGLILANHTLAQSEGEVSYFIVKRFLSGRWVRTIEYLGNREQTNNYTHVGADCSCPFGYTRQNVTLRATLSAITGETAVFSTDTDFFTAGDVGKIIIHEEGRAYVSTLLSPRMIGVTILNPFSHLRIPQSSLLRDMDAGVWMMDALRPSYRLPLNFRPASVTVSADAKVLENLLPDEGGTVTFPEDLSSGWIGFNFDCEFITLPFSADGTVIEDSRKNVKGVGLRFVRTRGMFVGTYGDVDGEEPELFSVETMMNPFMAEGALRRSDYDYVPVSSDWDENTRIIGRANGANPTEITGMVFDAEVGDEVQ